MAPIRPSSIRSIAEPSAILRGSNSTSATTKHHTSATCVSESGRSRGTQARKKACEYCYRVHKRCSGAFPCERCIKAGCAAECTVHKRQRHSRRGPGDVLPSATKISPSRSSSAETKDGENDSSILVEIDIEPAMAATRSPSAFPSPAIHPVLPSPRSALAASYVPHIDTVSSPSLLDSSTPTDENVSPIEDLLNACLANLASEGWRNDTEVWTWDTLEQQHRSPAALQMLFEDPELWGFIEALIPPVAAHGPQPVSRPISPGIFLT